MRERASIVDGLACVLAAALAGASCTGDVAGSAAARVGVAAQPETTVGWKLFNVGDANGDGLSDVFWVSTSGDRLAVWLLNGAHVLGRGPELAGPPGTGWEAVTTAEFNHDGLTDVIWGNAGAGTAAVQLLNGVHVLATGPELQGPGPGWVIANAGDVDGDGMADAVWYDAARERMAVWRMNGARVLARGPEIPAPPGAGWVLPSVADMNGDDLGDLLWANAGTNTVTVWLMNGMEVLARGPLIEGPGAGWTVVTAADCDHDGLNDVVWTNAARGTLAVWRMDGAQVLARGPTIAGPPGAGWVVAYAADTNGDGMADAIWQRTDTSHFAVWLMAGTQVLARGPEIVGPPESDAEAP